MTKALANDATINKDSRNCVLTFKYSSSCKQFTAGQESLESF
jgi:hypothetical protein